MHRPIHAFAILLAVLCASCATEAGDPRRSYYEMGGARNLATNSADAPTPPMRRGRKVSEQDCTSAVDAGTGNLRCK